MLNLLWPILIGISIIYALLTGNIQKVNDSIFEAASGAVELSVSLLGTICLWTGIMNILQKTSIIKKLTKLLNPIINNLFPEMKNNRKATEEISMNMVANLLGLGNAATPLGIKAMETMQKENPKKDTLTNSMVMFILINTASIQIIPTTVIGIRTSLKSISPTNIIFPVWIATICAAVAGITITKIFIKISKGKNI